MSRTVVWTPDMHPLGPSVAAIGVFDGVHIGHQALVADAVRMARVHDASSVVVTFDRDPDQVVSPAAAAPQLLDLEDKLARLAAQGPDVVLVVPFDERLAHMAPLSFLDEVLLSAISPVAAVVGYDFRFGHRAEGDVDTLVRYGAEHGFTVVAHELVRVEGEPVTSTRIRRLIAVGDVESAAALLGRPHMLRGEVVHGHSVGVTLGAPTANLAVRPYAAIPGDGVYAGWARVGEKAYAAGISVGTAPTFPWGDLALEANLLDFEGDLYGQVVILEFVQRLRDQVRFETPDDLADAIAGDLRQVRALLCR